MAGRTVGGDQLTQAMINALNRRGARARGRADDPREKLLRDLHYSGLPAPVLEFQFHPTRKWKLDLAWPAARVAVEIEGLVYTGRGTDNQLLGRHVSVTGFKADIEKYGTAFSLGWNVLRITSSDARSGVAVGWLTDYFTQLAGK